MHRFFTGLGRFTVKYRWIILVVWLVGTFAAVKGLPSLSSQVNNDNTAFLPSSAPDVKAANLAEPLVGKESLAPINVVVSRNGTQLTSADIPAVEREVTLLKGVKNVDQVLFLGESPNGQAAQIEALANINGFGLQPAIDAINSIEATFSKTAAPPGLEFHVSGEVADDVAENQASKSTGNDVQSLSLLFIIILLFLIFRSILAPFVTLLPAAIVLQLAGALIGELGSHGLKISAITQLLLIVLVLGAGTDYGLFLVFRVREGLRDGMDPKQAVALAVSRVGESISASAGTVILALLSLLFATFGIYHDLGIPLAIGIATMLLAGVTLLPALLAILGRAVFWPSKPRPGQAHTGAWGRLAGRIVARPVPTLVAGLVIFGVLACGVFFYTPAGFGGAVSAPAGSQAALGDAVIAKDFPQASSNPTNLVFQYPNSIWTNPAPVLQAQQLLSSSPLFNKVDGPLNPNGASLTESQFTSLHALLGAPRSLPALPPKNAGISLTEYETYRSLGQYVSTDGHTVQFSVALSAGDPSTTAALNAVPSVRTETQKVATATGATENGVAGEAPALYDVSVTSDDDLIHIVPLAAIAIALLLALVLRSLVAPLYLIASVVISYLAALGLASIVFIKLAGSGGLTFLLPFLMFIFLLALGEDYNILVMTRIREEAHDHPLREAVTRAVGASGPTITSAGLVLAGTFGVLAIAGGGGPGGDQVRDIGVGLAVGILMDTFLVRTLLVPSTVAILGRWNWWPSRVHAGMGYPGTNGGGGGGGGQPPLRPVTDGGGPAIATSSYSGSSGASDGDGSSASANGRHSDLEPELEGS
jgi:putative drug exporter of the RND superfamily